MEHHRLTKQNSTSNFKGRFRREAADFLSSTRKHHDTITSMTLDILAIGDTTTDAFIRLKDATTQCDIRHEHCLLCVRFGEKIPYESVTIVPGVGNAANAAVACARLGLNAALRANIGDDREGDECIASFQKNHVDTSLIVREQGKKTNYHYVLWYEAERTILIKHETYSYSLPPIVEAPKWVYFSSVGEGTLPYHQEIAAYLAAHPEVKFAFQPGTFQIKLGTQTLKDLYARADIFFCNKEEAQMILGIEETDEKKLCKGIRLLGVKIAVVTDGPNGLVAMDDAGAFHLPMYPDPAPPLQRTGAGDATASTTVAFLTLGYSLQESLMRGLINAASVVQGIGAQMKLLTRDEIEEWYAKRPSDFKPTTL